MQVLIQKPEAMKIKHLFLLSLLTLLAFSCKDNNSSFVQVKSIETEIYNAILSYRQSNELSGPFIIFKIKK